MLGKDLGSMVRSGIVDMGRINERVCQRSYIQVLGCAVSVDTQETFSS